MERVYLKKGKEKILTGRHHWIFSGAVESIPESYNPGDLAAIYSFEGKLLGHGFFKKEGSLLGRVVSFGQEDPYIALKKTLLNAFALRKSLINSEKTTAYRLINGEGDNLPGLIADKYGPYLVLQIGALGMKKLLPWLIEEFHKHFSLHGIYEKSTAFSLKEEALEPFEGILWGNIPEKIEVLEEGIRFLVDIKKGQKTGFFLDHREMRGQITSLSKGKNVLNAFCYTGGFTLAALKGGASRVDSVDISDSAIKMCLENVSLNGYSVENNGFYQKDVFDFLKENSLNYDLVILDPPAFAKKKQDIRQAMKGYQQLFSFAFEKMKEGSFLLISSCSYYISEELFEKIAYQAALHAKRPVKIIGQHRVAYDHPINLFHPESRYLKSLLLYL